MITRNYLVWSVAIIGMILSLITQIFIRVLVGVSAPEIPLIPNVLYFHYLELPSDTLFAFTSIPPWFSLIPITGIAATVILFSSFDKELIPLLKVGLELMLAGGMSNFIEKLIYGNIAVYLHFLPVHMPVVIVNNITIFTDSLITNIADILVYFGNIVTTIAIFYWLVSLIIQWLTR